LKSEKKRTKLTIELSTWNAFLLRKVAKKQGRTVSALLDDSMEAIFKNVSIYEIRLLGMEFRKKYKNWLDD
jgi:hypothetical protein